MGVRRQTRYEAKDVVLAVEVVPPPEAARRRQVPCPRPGLRVGDTAVQRCPERCPVNGRGAGAAAASAVRQQGLIFHTGVQDAVPVSLARFVQRRLPFRL
jgi:hypothetical protein